MAWVKIDDHYDEHPKFQRAGPLATSLWLRCLAYCNRNLTDGFIPHEIAAERAWSADRERPGDLIDSLVDAGLWQRRTHGFQMHDYHVYQPTRLQVLADREATRKRVASFRSRNSVTSSITNGVSTPSPVPVPVPVVPVPGPEKKTTLGHADARPAVENPQDPDEITADQAFDEVFWPAYPRKVAKRRAKKAWKALKLKDSDEEMLDRIMGALNRDKAKEWYNREPDKIPHPATWINDRRWEDG